MKEKTRYRKVYNGYWNTLQYEKHYKLFGFTIFTLWKIVPRPYCDYLYGRSLDFTGSKTEITDLRDKSDIDNFVKQWGYIEDYLKYFNNEQKELEISVNKKREEKKIGKISYLN